MVHTYKRVQYEDPGCIVHNARGADRNVKLVVSQEQFADPLAFALRMHEREPGCVRRDQDIHASAVIFTGTSFCVCVRACVGWVMGPNAGPGNIAGLNVDPTDGTLTGEILGGRGWVWWVWVWAPPMGGRAELHCLCGGRTGGRVKAHRITPQPARALPSALRVQCPRWFGIRGARQGPA